MLSTTAIASRIRNTTQFKGLPDLTVHAAWAWVLQGLLHAVSLALRGHLARASASGSCETACKYPCSTQLEAARLGRLLINEISRKIVKPTLNPGNPQKPIQPAKGLYPKIRKQVPGVGFVYVGLSGFRFRAQHIGLLGKESKSSCTYRASAYLNIWSLVQGLGLRA